MVDYGNPLPGVGSERTATPRMILLGGQPKFFPGGKIIDGSLSRDPLNTGDLDVLRAGLVMGKITTGGKYAPSILGVLTEAYDKDGTEDDQMTVSAATAVEINRRIGASGTFKITGPPSAAGTVATITVTYSAINVSTGVITCTAIAADMIAGSFIQPTDGSETPMCLVYEEYGIKVTDQDDTNQDTQFARMLVGGNLDSSQIINWPSDTSLQDWLKTQLTAEDQQFMFDDSF